jgi:DHA2 family multidrug resistance protein
MIAGACTAMVMTSASTLGPTIGGYVAGFLGWRALFWINVVPGLLIALLVWTQMRQLEGPKFDLLKRIDLLGLLALALFLGGAEYTLEEAPSNEWFASTEVRTWAFISLMGGLLFFWRALTVETPIVDLRPFRSPTFAVGSTLIFITGIGLFGSVFLTPLFLSTVRGYNSLQIGHTMMVQGASMFLAGPIIGYFGRKLIDTRMMALIGGGLVASSCWVQAHMTAEAGFWELALPQAMRGMGLMLSTSALMTPSIQSLPPDQVHAGTALFSTVRNVGGAFGIAGLATVQLHGFALHRQELYAAANPSNPHVAGMIAGAQAHLAETGAVNPERQAIMHYAGLLDREALVMAFNDQFMVIAIVTALAMLPIVFLRARPYVSVNMNSAQSAPTGAAGVAAGQ